MTRKVLASGLSRQVFPIGEKRETVLGKPSAEALRFPFYWTLPRDPVESLKWKIYCRERCLTDLPFRENIMYMASQDVAFFAETFVTIFEPRPPRPIPMTLWLDQVDWLAWLEECYGERDLGAEKSRGIGVSVLCALFYYHKFRFDGQAKIGLMSKDEAALDGPDFNSLLGKIVFMHEHMPAWFRYGATGRDVLKRNQTDHILINVENGATIQGFVPTNDKVRSYRFTSLLMDEFAFLPNNVQAIMNSSVHTSPNRVFVSTWNGSDNEFHNIMRVTMSTLLRVEMYWWNNTERWQGAYRYEKGRLVILDTSYVFPPDYPFRDTELITSPWVDFELRRAGSNVQSALEELYGLQGGEGRKLIRKAAIDIAKATVRPPTAVGDIYETADGELIFQASPDGVVKLWGDVGNGKGGPFSAGCDIAFGREATFSTCEVVALHNGSQVAEIAVNDLDPIEFAQLVFLFLRWLNGDKGDENTFLTFEKNGDQGTSFGDELVRLGYGNIKRTKYKTVVASNKASAYLGEKNGDGGLANLLELARAIISGECTIRSEEMLWEFELFTKDEKGKPSFPKCDLGHGDRAQGMGLAWNQARSRILGNSIDETETDYRTREREPEPEQTSWEAAWAFSRN